MIPDDGIDSPAFPPMTKRQVLEAYIQSKPGERERIMSIDKPGRFQLVYTFPIAINIEDAKKAILSMTDSQCFESFQFLNEWTEKNR